MVSGILVGKHINGILLNDLEYLLDDGGTEPMRFQNEDAAKAFLRKHGFTDEYMKDMWFIEEDDGEREWAE